MENQKSMMLVTADYSETIKTFKMIPVSKDCVYVEVVYLVDHKALVAINRLTKNQFKFLPKINGNGDVEMLKNSHRPGKQQYKEERLLVNVNYEHHIIEREEQEAFIKMFAVNADTFDYKQYLDKTISAEETPTMISVGLPDQTETAEEESMDKVEL